MLALRKAIEQRQKASKARIVWIKRSLRRINNSLWDKHEHDDYNTNELQNV